MDRKPRGKYVPGHEPWAILGVKEATFHARMKMLSTIGDEARQAKQRALDIASGAVVPDPVETVAPAATELASAVEPTIAPEEPEAVEAPAPAALNPASAVEEVEKTPRYSPAASLSVPSEPPPPAVAGATVFVSFRCPATVHDRMRNMAHKKRVKLQGIVGAAVEAYLSQNGF